MNTRVRRHLLLSAPSMALAFALCNAPVRAAAEPPSDAAQCNAGEQVLFACTLSGTPERQLSVCGSADLAVGQGTIQVHLGVEGRSSTTFPDAGIPPTAVFTYSRYTAPQVTYLAMTYSYANTKYTLYDDSSMGQTARGLRIEPLGGEPQDALCNGPVQGSLMSVEGPLPRSSG